jgi:hypothetical protein
MPACRVRHVDVAARYAIRAAASSRCRRQRYAAVARCRYRFFVVMFA